MSVWPTKILVHEKNSGWKRRGRKRGKTQRLGRRVCALAASEVNATQLKQKTKSLSKCLDVSAASGVASRKVGLLLLVAEKKSNRIDQIKKYN